MRACGAGLKHKAAEWIWRASPSLGPDASVFTGLTGSYSGNYGPPGGFCWDVKCRDEPVVDDPTLDTYNVPSRVADFVRAARAQAEHTRGSHVLFTMGSDYQYEAAEEWFESLDKIVTHVNAASATTGVSAKYSSMDAYVAAKRTDKSVVGGWPLKTDDMFPYADGPHMFWTGYFTSRPALKRYIRTASAQLQTVRQLIAFTPNAPAGATRELEEALGVVQHHDAVTGTEMQHVAFDYAARIHRGAAAADSGLDAALRHLVPSSATREWARCELLNVSLCAPTQKATWRLDSAADSAAAGAAGGAAGTSGGDPLLFAVYNPLAQPVTALLSLPISTAAASVRAHDGSALAVQVVPSLHPVTNYDQENGAAAPFTALVEVELPPVSLTPMTLTATKHTAAPAAASTPAVAAPFRMANAHLALDFDARGALVSVTRSAGGRDAGGGRSLVPTPVSLAIEPRAYIPHHSVPNFHGPRGADQPSGAYIFRPNSTAAPLRPDGAPRTYQIVGDADSLVQEVRQVWSDWVNVTLRLSRSARSIEMIVTAGPLPATNGTELIMHMASNISSHGEMFSDANGREMQRRLRDKRPSWNFTQTEDAAGNYFPMTTAAYIRDTRAQLTLLADASQGVASLKDGSLEVMLHRRLVQDDARGVREPLNETENVQPYSTAAESLAGVDKPAVVQLDGGGTAAIGSALVHPLTDGNGIGLLGMGNLGGGEHTGRGLLVRARYKISVEPSEGAAAAWRPEMDQMYGTPQLFFSPGASLAPPPMQSFLAAALPSNLQLVTLQKMDSHGAHGPRKLLLRIGHQFGILEHPTLSKPTSVDLAKLFAPAAIELAGAVEMSLSANQPKQKMLRRREKQAAEARAARSAPIGARGGEWIVEGEATEPPPHSWRQAPPLQWDATRGGSSVVTLGPLEIKTFILTLK